MSTKRWIFHANVPAIAVALVTIFALPLMGIAPLGAAETVAPSHDAFTTVHVGSFPSGPNDAITDVAGVRVAHVTKISGSSIRDGATVVVPNADPWTHNLLAATYVINGNGALTNRDWIDESGRLQTPIVLVGNTLDVGRAYDGVIAAMIAEHPAIGRTDDVPLPVVGEIDGQRLNDAQLRVITADDTAQAIHNAHGGNFERGAVGAGTPSTTFGYKGGIGSSSRMLPAKLGGYRIGVLVNANMDVRDHLTIAGVRVGPLLPHDDLPRVAWGSPQRDGGRMVDGSIIIVIATDAPLSSLQLKALAERSAIGLYRSGSISRVSSGDQVIAFTTASPRIADPDEQEAMVNALYECTGDATESAIDNALLSASTMHGNGSTVHGIPHAALLRILQAHRAL